MIRMIQNSSPDQAKDYFTGSLIKSDYYLNDQELPGAFLGHLSRRLGLNPEANKEQFFQLCENISPATGKNLTPRYVANRTVNYDISMHAPKSVSVLHALSKDGHILEVFQKAVRDTMSEIEADSMTRVRKNGKDEDRHAGEMVYAEFYHITARPSKDHLPDPHLHAHNVVFNAVFDPIEQEIKAGQFRYIKRDMPYYQARFQKRLSDGLVEKGYQVRKTAKSFEVVGVPQSVIDHFSKRTNEIGQFSKEHGIDNPTVLDQLGARTRSKKMKGLTMEQLQADWKRQIRELDPELREGNNQIRNAPNKSVEPGTAQKSIDFAKSHSFERSSVVLDRRLLASAYTYSIAKSGVSLDDIDQCFAKQKDIIRVKEGHDEKCTTVPVLKEEQEMIALAKSGKNKFRPLYNKVPELKGNKQQNAALEHILTTTNQVSIVRGAAGTGKTTIMTEAKKLVNDKGLKMYVVAPTAKASRGVLVEEGFENAETVARLLHDKKFQEKLQGQMLWVDEAGQLGMQDGKAILEIANKNNTRLVYGGDTKQHSSVARGDFLRVLNQVGKIPTAEVTKIYRQKNKIYKAAVMDLSNGNVKSGFEKLDHIKSIKEIDPLKPNEQLVSDYMAFKKQGQSLLVISPTHDQGQKVTADIRKALKEEKYIGQKDVQADKLVNLNYTEAQKQDYRSYQNGQLIHFNQHAPEFKKGSRWKVKNIEQQSIAVTDGHSTKSLPLDRAKHFELFRHDKIDLTKGDRVRITKGSYDKAKNSLNNGQSFEIAGFEKTGEIRLINPKSKAVHTIPRNFGYIDHDYCTTSHSSQGATVDRALISQPASTFEATSAKQFYVSVSRARNGINIYTDDKDGLLESASRHGDRQSASELVSQSAKQNDHLHHLERSQSYTNQSNKIVPSTPLIKTEDYEPGL